MVVVGGGPAGSVTAAVLAASGHDVLLLDRARFPRDKTCTEFTSPELVRVLDTLGVRAGYEANPHARLSAMEIFAPSGASFRIEYEDAPALAMRRRLLDALLLDRARELGAEVREGVRVRGLLMGGRRVEGVVAAGADGTERPILARLVVGADGLHSVVARELGVHRAPLWPRRLGLVAHFEGSEELEGHGEMHVRGHGYCGIAPVHEGMTSVGIALDLTRCRPRGSREELFARALRSFPGARRHLERARMVGGVSGVGPMARSASRVAGDGWALVGDAAGFFDPFTGEGIYRACRGALLLGEIASSALRRGGVVQMERYPRARRAELGHKSLVVALVQLCVSYPRLLEYLAPRLRERGSARSTLSRVVGDRADARRALVPGFVLEAAGP